jgi:hypothetical protein
MLEVTRAARTPTDHDKARLEQLLGAALAAGVAPPASAAAHAVTTKAAGAAAAVKWTGIAVLALAAGGGYIGWRASHRAPASVPVAIAVAARPTALPEPAQSAPAISEPTPAAEAAAARIDAELQPRASRLGRAQRLKPGAATLPAELDLLHEAQSSLQAGNAASALSLLTAHRKRYPRSQLASERDALTVLSLCAINRAVEARSVARRFLETAPRSPLKTSVEESCAGR